MDKTGYKAAIEAKVYVGDIEVATFPEYLYK